MAKFESALKLIHVSVKRWTARAVKVQFLHGVAASLRSVTASRLSPTGRNSAQFSCDDTFSFHDAKISSTGHRIPGSHRGLPRPPMAANRRPLRRRQDAAVRLRPKMDRAQPSSVSVYAPSRCRPQPTVLPGSRPGRRLVHVRCLGLRSRKPNSAALFGVGFK